MTRNQDKPPVDIAAAFRDGKVIDEALKRGVRQALWRHKQLGQSIVVCRDGEIVFPPEEIEIESGG